jgi:hypothetical protein
MSPRGSYGPGFWTGGEGWLRGRFYILRQQPVPMKLHQLIPFFLFLITIAAFSQNPPPKREFRAVWIATVANIDWPSQKGLASGCSRTNTGLF